MNVLDLQEELLRMPEWERLSEVRQFTLSLEIFQRNAQDFRTLLDHATTPPTSVQLWSVPNRPLLEQFQREVARQLHNFVAAAFSLVDHARRFVGRQYKGTQTFPDYEPEVKRRFAEEPLCQFVQGLRNYSIHRKPPPIGSRMTLAQGQAPHHKVYVPKAALLDFDWNATARRFLNGADDEIDVQAILNSYSAHVTAFYEWMFKRLQEIHADDVAAVAAKQKAARVEFGKRLPHILETDLSIAAQIRVQPEHLLAPYIDPTRFADICRTHTAPGARANALLDVIEEYSPPLGEIRSRFVALFESHYSRP